MNFRSPLVFLNDAERMIYGRELIRARAHQRHPFEVAPRVNIRRFDGTLAAAGEPVLAADFAHYPDPDGELRRLVNEGSVIKV
jgi:hypothetical protein